MITSMLFVLGAIGTIVVGALLLISGNTQSSGQMW